MNYIWLICILASCLMFGGSFDNLDSLKTLTIQLLIFRNPNYCTLKFHCQYISQLSYINCCDRLKYDMLILVWWEHCLWHFSMYCHCHANCEKFHLPSSHAICGGWHLPMTTESGGHWTANCYGR